MNSPCYEAAPRGRG